LGACIPVLAVKAKGKEFLLGIESDARLGADEGEREKEKSDEGEE